MAATHGAGQDPMAVHVNPVHAYSQKSAQHLGGPQLAKESRTQVWTCEIKKYGVGGMDEVWNRKYEPGPIRDGDRFDRIDLCAYSAPEAHGITELVSDLNFSSRGRQFQRGRSRPLEAPRQKLSSA